MRNLGKEDRLCRPLLWIFLFNKLVQFTIKCLTKNKESSQAPEFTPVILATGEAATGKMTVGSQPGQKFTRPSEKIKAEQGVHLPSQLLAKHK
jgi:hypothetical protein